MPSLVITETVYPKTKQPNGRAHRTQIDFATQPTILGVPVQRGCYAAPPQQQVWHRLVNYHHGMLTPQKAQFSSSNEALAAEVSSPKLLCIFATCAIWRHQDFWAVPAGGS